MSRYLPRICRAFLLAFPIVAGVIAVSYTPRPAAAQTTEPVCWAEWCEGNTCIRIKVKCPAVIEPVT
jgi:hypothetical protein